VPRARANIGNGKWETILTTENATVKLIEEDRDEDYCPAWDVIGEANATLAAASPDLLAALEYAVAQYGKPGGPWNVPSDPGGWLDRARDAIAKAKGVV